MKFVFRAILALACGFLTAAGAAEPGGPEMFFKPAASPPPPDPLLREASPPVKLGVGWSGTTHVSFGFASGWANASVDLSRVEIHAADPGGHPPVDGPRHLSTEVDFPESSFSWQMAPYRERLAETNWHGIDRWDAETMRDLGLIDLSVAPEGFRPYRTGDALYFFDPDSRRSLAWVRYQGRSPHPPDHVETGRMTLDDDLEWRCCRGTVTRDLVWKGGPDANALNLPARTIRTTLRQAADGSWSLGWSAAPGTEP